MKQQLSITKVLLRTFNEIISDMEYNNGLIQKGLTELKTYMEKFIGETEEKIDLISLKINVEGHISRINNTLNAVQRNLDLIIESTVKLGYIATSVPATPCLLRQIFNGTT
jgi:hypothetical protein